MKARGTIIACLVMVGLLLAPTTKVYASDAVEQEVETVAPVYRQSKNVDVKLTKEYEKCSFVVTFEEAGEYVVKLTSPEGKEYEAFKIDDKTMCCEVSNCETGTWRVNATCIQENEIGKISVSVQASQFVKSDDMKEVSIGRDITGLKIYFKNRDLHIEWTDTSIGNVSIKVNNLETNENLAEDKVAEKEYVLPIADNVEKIKIEIVPSESSSVDGATRYYTEEVGINPDAEVNFPQFDVLNENEVEIPVTLNGNYGVMVEDNGKKVFEHDLLESGEYSFTIPLIDNSNHLEYFIVDAEGNMKSWGYDYYVDITPPNLSLTADYNNIVTEEEVACIKGNVSDYCELYLNETRITDISVDGYFAINVDLHEGENKLVLSAYDLARNEIQYEINITRVIPDDSIKLEPKDIVMIFIAVICVAYLIYSKIKSKKGGGDNTPLGGGKSKFSRDVESKSDDVVADDSFKQELDARDKEIEAERFRATHDTLTGCKNRLAYSESISKFDIKNVCIVNFDVNNLKVVNDTLGHQKGDILLTTVADAIKKYFGDVYRMGGDEFTVIGTEDIVSTIAEKLNALDRYLASISTEELKFEVSHGYASSKDFGRKASYELLYNEADRRMYADKKYKKGGDLSRKESAYIDIGEESLLTKILRKLGIGVNKIVDDTKEDKKFNLLYLIPLAILLVLFVATRFMIVITECVSSSMEETILVGDTAIFNKLNKEVERGDIITFTHEELGNDLIGKRIIGLPNETVSFENGFVYIDDRKLDESAYIPDKVETNCIETFTVPEDCYFVLGDNRENSADSRIWNNPYVKAEDIEGKLWFIIPTSSLDK